MLIPDDREKEPCVNLSITFRRRGNRADQMIRNTGNTQEHSNFDSVSYYKQVECQMITEEK